MTIIQKWRENAMMSRKDMSRKFDIPVRTLENWDAEVNAPPDYVKKLILEKLMIITSMKIEEKWREIMKEIPSDKNGNRPVGSWAVISTNGNDEFIDLYDNMVTAINNIGSTSFDKHVSYVLCNNTVDGLKPYYTDRNGKIYHDHDCIKL